MKIKSKNSFFYNVTRLLTGNITAQAISVLSIPIITRLFPPESYGKFSIYISIVLMFSIISSLSYVSAIPLPESDVDAVNIMGLSIGVVLFVSILVLFFILFFSEKMCLSLGGSEMKPYLWLLPLSIFLDGTYCAFNYWSLRKNRYNVLSISRISESLFDRICGLTFGAIGYISALMLIISRIIGVLLSIITLGFIIIKRESKIITQSIDPNNIVLLAKRYYKFPLVSNWSVMLNNISRQIPIVMLTFFFNPKIVGYYAVSVRVLAIPMSLLGDAMFKVFFQKITEIKHKNGSIDEISIGLLKYLTLIMLVPMAFIAIIGSDIFILIFGEQWAIAGLFSQVLSITFFMSFISRPFVAIFYVYERQEVRFYFDLMLVLVSIFAFAIGGVMKRPLIGITIFSIASSLVYLVFIYWVFRMIGIQGKHLLNRIIANLYNMLPFVFMMGALRYFLNAFPTITIISCTVLLVIFYFFTLYRDEKLKNLLGFS